MLVRCMLMMYALPATTVNGFLIYAVLPVPLFFLFDRVFVRDYIQAILTYSPLTYSCLMYTHRAAIR